MTRPNAPGGKAHYTAGEFEQLFGGLVAHVERAAGGTFSAANLLKKTLYEAALACDRVRWAADDVSQSTFHELGISLADGAPAVLARVIEILKHESNRENVLIALGAPARDPSMTSRLAWPESDRPAVERAVAEYEAGLSFLDKIARAVPPPPPAGPRHRPSKKKDLRAALEVLADYWEWRTGNRFTQAWQKGGPRKGGGHLRVPDIDPERLDDLPGVTEAIVAARGPRRPTYHR